MAVHDGTHRACGRGKLYAKVKARVDEARDQRHRFDIGFNRDDDPCRLEVLFHLVVRARGLVFNRSSRWLGFEIPFPEFG